MEEIKLCITNPNNVTYKGIVLRKFFYMIFIDASGRKLYAYVATVFGGLTEEIEKGNTEKPYEKPYKSVKNVSQQACALEFAFNSDSNLIESTDISNVTNSFFQQTTYIERVWGKCEVLNNQEEVNAALKELYPSLYTPSKVANIDVSKNTIIRIEDKENGVSHNCIVTKGEYAKITQAKYKLSCPVAGPSGCIDGLEAMNWIKVEIGLKRNILEEPVLFTINLGKEFLTPDFTWYFAPPLGNVVSADSYVKIDDI